MSYFKCPHCSQPSYIFGKGGARKTADEMELGFVGEVRLYPLWPVVSKSRGGKLGRLGNG